MAVESKPKTEATPTEGLRLAERLRSVCVGARRDLKVTRHLFRGEPAYLVSDPLTLQSHRLGPDEYAVFVSLRRDRTLGQIFEERVSRGEMSREDEESFYEFVFMLHRLSFLNQPISDHNALYQRHLARRQARRRTLLFGFLFLRVPMVNPDAFLERTVGYARFLFSRWFFVLWLCLIGAAATTVVRNLDGSLQPLDGILAARNLPLMWVTLVLLKLVHELGHAYACKHYGGSVPEMGLYFILFTPCAYVDATSSWTFTRKWERMVVCLAGVYVESTIAALAVFVWSATTPGFLHSAAYNVVFLAGLMTVVFNINPLVRYDGYYVLSDLLEIPNLRQQSTRYLLGVAKRFAVGVPMVNEPRGLRLKCLLLGFGAASNAYRAAVLVAIAAILMAKLSFVGAAIAGVYLGSIVVALLARMVRYLSLARETAPVRLRAVAVSIMLLVGIPAGALLLPVRSTVDAAGVLGAEREEVTRALVDGFVNRVHVRAGDEVAGGNRLVEMTNDSCLEALAEAEARLEGSRIRQKVYEATDLQKALEEREKRAVFEMDLDRCKADLADLVVTTESPATVITAIRDTDIGRFVREGEPLVATASGRWQVRALLTQEDLAAAQPAIGQQVEVRLATRPEQTLEGVVARLTPAGTRSIRDRSLTHLGGGSIAVNPDTQTAGQAYFEAAIDLPLQSSSSEFRPGASCRIRFPAESATAGTLLWRHVLRTADKLGLE